MPGYRVVVKETRTVVRVRRILYGIVDAKDERAVRDLFARAYETWVRVTFPAKPSREILVSLRTAGFRWAGGSWHGERSKLPEGVSQHG